MNLITTDNIGDDRAEKTVVLHVLADPKAIYEIPRLLPEHFQHANLRYVYSACKTVVDNGATVEPLTVINQMEADGTLKIVGGSEGLKQLYGQRGWGGLKQAEAAVLRKWQRRQMLDISHKMRTEAPDPTTDVDGVLSEVATRIDQVANYVSESKELSLEQQVNGWSEYVKSRFETQGLNAMPFTNIEALDNNADLSGGNLGIVSGLPGTGKSAFFNTIVNTFIDTKRPIDVWSGENSVRQQLTRLIALRSGIAGTDLKMGKHLPHPELVEKVEQAKQDILNSDVIITAGSMSAPGMISRIKYLHSTKGIDTFLFDRLELIDTKEFNRDDEAGKGELMARLRVLAVDMDITILMACQLRKSAESRPSCRPELQDLKGNSAVGDSATHVFMLTRPEYHGITEDSQGRSTNGRGEIMMVKNTEGEPLNVECKFDGERSLWHEADDEDFDIPSATFPTTKPYGSNVIAGYRDDVEVTF